MSDIIKLHTRHGNDEIYVNADTINAFKTVGFDKPFTVVTTNFFQIEVTETSDEIMQFISHKI